MANENNINVRMQQKHDIEINWLKSVYVDGIKGENNLKTNPFIPKAGEIIVYDTDENYSYIRFKIGDGIKNVDDLEFVNLTFKDVDEKPEDNILENVIYRYTTTTENIYAISGARKNIVITDLGAGEKTYNIQIEVIDTLPSTGTSVINVNKLDTTPITLYYNKNTRTVHAYVDSFLKLALAIKDINVDTGWNNPSSVLGSSYKDIAFTSVLEAGYGEAGVVHEIITNMHADYYYQGQWYELPIEANEHLVKRLRDISKEKFDDKDNEVNINVRAYKSINNDFDRVYVETANGEQSGDYCLTPKADTLPENPWEAAAEDVVYHIPSVPVRNERGEISVYIDDNSKGDMAVSKQYLEENTYQYVRRKPEEAEDVYNANIISAHTWIPDDNLYRNFTEPFSSSTVIPTVSDATDDTLVASYSDSNEANSIQITQNGENYVVDCVHPTSAQSKYRFIRQGTKNELVFSTDIKIVPASDITNNRGFTMVAKNSITEDNSIWGGSNLSVEYAKGGDEYKLTFLGTTISFADYVGDWVNLRIEMDNLGKGGAVRLYLNNTLKISGELTASIVAIKSYDFMIYTWNNSNSGFRGNIYFDNMYFGDVPEAVKYAGYDSLTPVAYDYADESVAKLGADTLVLRKTDGSVLTKRELTDADDDRVAASKHYVDNQINMLQGNPSEGLEYTLSDDETYYIVTGIGTCTDTKLVIPLTYNNKPVKEVGESAFYYNDEAGISGAHSFVTEVVLPESIEKIGNDAFRADGSGGEPYWNSTIESIRLPEYNCEIGNYAFRGCCNLKSINLPKDLEILAEGALSECKILKHIDLPNTLVQIESIAFNGCTQTFTSLEIPNKVTSIGHDAFTSCSNITDIILPKSIQVIGDDAFYDCASLTDIYYSGDEEEWSQISIGIRLDDYFDNATIHYNFASDIKSTNEKIDSILPTKDTSDGAFLRFIDGQPKWVLIQYAEGNLF